MHMEEIVSQKVHKSVETLTFRIYRSTSKSSAGWKII